MRLLTPALAPNGFSAFFRKQWGDTLSPSQRKKSPGLLPVWAKA
jgi:hypothetical protein